MDHLISGRKPDLIKSTKTKTKTKKKNMRICKIFDLAVLADHKIKLKECEKKDKYLNLAEELKNTMGQLYQ